LELTYQLTTLFKLVAVERVALLAQTQMVATELIQFLAPSLPQVVEVVLVLIARLHQ
jgi:hypothetical protein